MNTKQIPLKNILFITQGDKTTASTRVRVLSFINLFNDSNISTKILSLPPKTKPLSRIAFILKILLNSPKFQIIYIQKILLPKPIIALLNLLCNKLVFDWDDALYTSPPSNILNQERLISNQSKLQNTLKNCSLIICGNKHLEEYAKQFNNNTEVIPTCVDRINISSHNQNNNSIIIGWIGRKENLIYLESLSDVFLALEEKYNNRVFLKVVCDEPVLLPGFNNLINIKWNLDTEKADLSSFSIGIMPLSDDEWTRGKCAYKLLQYMATGVPCIGSAVGANNEVITHNHNGLLASNNSEWLNMICDLIDKPTKREALAANALDTIQKKYIITAVFPNLLQALTNILD